mgnify:FL=1
MKNVLFILMGLLSLTVAAQNKGRFETHDFGNFKLHVYYTNDALGDASYIIESKNALVTLEQPLFKDNVAEYDAYLLKLGKPVEKRITDYHLGGTGNHDIVMVKGMPEFTKGDVYGGMMKGFSQMFGNAIVPLPSGKITEVDLGTTQTYAGIPFQFIDGASTDFPGASILIGNKVYFSHWTPLKVHVSHLHISSPEAIDAQIKALEQALKTKAVLFIGGHGGASQTDAVKFKISYLKQMKKLLGENKTPETFIEALKNAYPDMPGEDGLGELAKALYR